MLHTALPLAFIVVTTQPLKGALSLEALPFKIPLADIPVSVLHPLVDVRILLQSLLFFPLTELHFHFLILIVKLVQ